MKTAILPFMQILYDVSYSFLLYYVLMLLPDAQELVSMSLFTRLVTLSIVFMHTTSPDN